MIVNSQTLTFAQRRDLSDYVRQQSKRESNIAPVLRRVKEYHTTFAGQRQRSTPLWLRVARKHGNVQVFDGTGKRVGMYSVRPCGKVGPYLVYVS